MWDPWDAAEQAPIDVFEVEMATTAFYEPTRPVIALRTSLTDASKRSALAHELGHHELGHLPTADSITHARQEQQAARWAAVRMVNLEDLAEAMAGAASWFEVAEELHVDPELLEVRVLHLDETEQRRLLQMIGTREIGL